MRILFCTTVAIMVMYLMFPLYAVAHDPANPRGGVTLPRAPRCETQATVNGHFSGKRCVANAHRRGLR